MFDFDMLINSNEVAAINYSLIHDLSLTCLSTILEENEYNIFIEVLSRPLVKKDDIVERQKIISDFLNYPTLIPEINYILSKIDELVIKPDQYNTADFYDLSKRINVGLDRLEFISDIFNQSIKLPRKLLNQLSDKIFQSKTLNQLTKELSNKINKLEELQSVINTLSNHLLKRELQLYTTFSSGFKLSRGYVLDEKAHVLRRKSKKDYKTYSFHEDFILRNLLDEIFLRGIFKQSTILEQVNKEILNLFFVLKKQLPFYTSAVKIIDFLKNNQINYCFPNFIDETTPRINTLHLYDISLAVYIKHHKHKTELISNDFHYEDYKIYIISGLNQGGKTTFLKSIGSSQLFAQSGLVVPAKDYVCTTFDCFISHFPKEEDDTLENGKFKEELFRLHHDLRLIKKKNLFLFNEPFSSTTTLVGTEVAYDLLKALSHTSSVIIMVTHLYELTLKVSELNDYIKDNQKALNLISMYNENSNGIERLYKILKGEPSQRINISEFNQEIQTL